MMHSYYHTHIYILTHGPWEFPKMGVTQATIQSSWMTMTTRVAKNPWWLGNPPHQGVSTTWPQSVKDSQNQWTSHNSKVSKVHHVNNLLKHSLTESKSLEKIFDPSQSWATFHLKAQQKAASTLQSVGIPVVNKGLEDSKGDPGGWYRFIWFICCYEVSHVGMQSPATDAHEPNPFTNQMDW